jgi:transposase
MDTPLATRQHIVHLHEVQHMTYRRIASLLNVGRSTVGDVINLWQQTGEVKSRRCGRIATNLALGKRTVRLLVRESVINPRATARQLRDCVGGEASRVSLRTIQRCLKRGDRCAFRPQASPSLNKKQKQTRLLWGRKYKQWTRDQWSKVNHCLENFL